MSIVTSKTLNMYGKVKVFVCDQSQQLKIDYYSYVFNISLMVITTQMPIIDT